MKPAKPPFLTPFLFLAGAAFLVIFAKFWETGVGMSTTSYGALAKDIAQNGHWFNPTLGPKIFDPFVDHPYLILWLDAIFFKIFGVSAQAIRLSASLLGLAVFVTMIKVAAKQFDLRASIVAVISLFLINIYMNFNSSGWLDMGMIGLTWLGFYFSERSRHNENWYGVFLAGLFLGLAILAKGVAALAVGPIFIWFLLTVSGKKFGKRVLFVFALGAPIAVFSLLHYLAEGFFFWQVYLQRQFFSLNNLNGALAREPDHFWYLRALFYFGHLVTLFGLFGIYDLWKDKKKDIALLILAEVLVHTLIYSFSSRHYDQYVIPVFPWLAISTGYFVVKHYPKIDEWKWSRGVFALTLLYFVLIDLLPVRVHYGSEAPFRVMMKEMERRPESKKVFFIGAAENQDTWEDMATSIAWYWNKTPVPIDWSRALEQLANNPEHNLLVSWRDQVDEKTKALVAQSENIKICLENEELILYANKNDCSEEQQRFRPADLRWQKFTP